MIKAIITVAIYRRGISIIALLVLVWLTMPGTAASSSLETSTENQPTKTVVQPLKTYYLNVLPEAGRREVKLDFPAYNIAVISQSGDTTVRCGDAINNYSCSPGKRLELKYEAAPLKKFWAENTTETPVRLQIDVYEVAIEKKQDSSNIEEF